MLSFQLHFCCVSFMLYIFSVAWPKNSLKKFTKKSKKYFRLLCWLPHSAFITFSVAPKMLRKDGVKADVQQEEKPLVAKEGGELDIPCPIYVPEGQAQPKVLWTLNSRPLNLNTPEFDILV